MKRAMRMSGHGAASSMIQNLAQRDAREEMFNRYDWFAGFVQNGPRRKNGKRPHRRPTGYMVPRGERSRASKYMYTGLSKVMLSPTILPISLEQGAPNGRAHRRRKASARRQKYER